MGTHFFGEFTYPLTNYWSLSGILGFRQAEVNDLTYDTVSTGTKVDFSGPMLRVSATCDFSTGK